MCSPRFSKTKVQEMIMKSLIAVTLVALSLLSTVPARAAAYDDAPEWVQRAFENNTGA
jgi:CHASE1-domain containing sensor protein